MSSKSDAMIKKLTADLKALKVAIKADKSKGSKAPKAKKESKGSGGKKADRPSSINKCKNKADLDKFTCAELKEWLVAKKVEKISSLKKDELVSMVFKKLKKKAEPESDSESESDSSDDSDSESDSDSD
jgi:hypothetical protein